MIDFDGLAAVKSCNTYLLKLNDDGVLVESFDCGRNWSKAEFTTNIKRREMVEKVVRDMLSPVSYDVAQRQSSKLEGLSMAEGIARILARAPEELSYAEEWEEEHGDLFDNLDELLKDVLPPDVTWEEWHGIIDDLYEPY